MNICYWVAFHQFWCDGVGSPNHCEDFPFTSAGIRGWTFDYDRLSEVTP